MTRTYVIPRASAAYVVGSSLVWFGLVAGGLMTQLPHDGTPAFVAAALPILLFALLPALAYGWSITYRIKLIDDTECEFRALLRRRRVRVHQIRAITWDETDIYLAHDHGKIHMVYNQPFEGFLVRLFELNPGIKANEDVRTLLKLASDTVGRGE